MSTFDIFIDYTCPWVAQIYPWIVDVLSKDKSLKVNWRSFPLEQINNELDEQQKIMIKMNFFENKSHKKIADELEIPLGTVKSRIRHILTKMQGFLR